MTDHKIWIDLVTAIGALVFGTWQVLINRHLKSIQDYVSIAAVPDTITGKIKFLNTGKVNLYLWGFDFPDRNHRFEKGRLITAGTNDSSYYWIDPPNNLSSGEEFSFTLYLEDDFGRKWASHNGGKAEEIEVVKDGVKQKALSIVIWSHRTIKSRWDFFK